MRVFIALLFAVSIFTACTTEPVVAPATTSTTTSSTAPMAVVAAPTTAPPPPPTTTTTALPATTIVPEPVVAVPANELESLICATFADDCGKALSVVYCESRFNPATVGSAGERGLFQIHPVHVPYLAERGLSWDAMFDPAANISYAHDLYLRQGWGPWTCA